MLKSAILAGLLVGGLSGAALGGDLACRGEDGVLLTIGDNRINRATPDGMRIMELDEWGICFNCAGMPALRLTLNDQESGGKAWVSVGVRPCGASDAPVAERYCLTGAGLQIGSRLGGKCSFPEGTTLADLWGGLTRSAPPELRHGWWVYRRE